MRNSIYKWRKSSFWPWAHRHCRWESRSLCSAAVGTLGQTAAENRRMQDCSPLVKCWYVRLSVMNGKRRINSDRR